MKDLSGHLSLLTRDHAAGIDNLERSSIPGGIAIYAVSSDARLIRNYGPALPDDPVEQSGFSNVRPADNGDQGQRGVHEGLRSGFRIWDRGFPIADSEFKEPGKQESTNRQSGIRNPQSNFGAA